MQKNNEPTCACWLHGTCSCILIQSANILYTHSRTTLTVEGIMYWEEEEGTVSFKKNVLRYQFRKMSKRIGDEHLFAWQRCALGDTLAHLSNRETPPSTTPGKRRSRLCCDHLFTWTLALVKERVRHFVCTCKRWSSIHALQSTKLVRIGHLVT